MIDVVYTPPKPHRLPTEGIRIGSIARCCSDHPWMQFVWIPGRLVGRTYRPGYERWVRVRDNEHTREWLAS